MGDFDEWTEAQKKAMGRVAAGLVEGDLTPLADYFRSGFTEIEKSLAAELADVIDSQEGYTPYRLEAIARRKGYQCWSASIEAHHRKMRLGVFMQRRMEEIGRGGYESALEETKERFDLKDRAVANSLNYLREYLAEGETRPDWDHWSHLKDFYCTD